MAKKKTKKQPHIKFSVKAPTSLQKRIKKLKKMVKHPTKRQLKLAAPVAVVVVVGLAVVLTQAVGGGNKPGSTDAQASDAYRQQLIGEVDNVTGAPRDGRDPASQRQSSLADAASNPTGAGQRKDSTASGVNGGGTSSGPTDNNGSLLNGSGCYYNYGSGGQCLAAHVATNGQTTCGDVRGHGGFPDGIVVNGTNHFNLADTDGDKIVCEKGEG